MALEKEIPPSEENNEGENPSNKAEISRRSALHKLIGVLGLSLFLASPSETDAQARLQIPNSRRAKKTQAFDAQVYEKYKESEPYMDEKELEIMQKSQEAIFRHYINPGFINYIERAGYKEEVDKALDIAIKHPFYLEYKTNDGVTEIFKRTKMPDQDGESVKSIMDTIPRDFYIKIEGNYITKVGNRVLVNTLLDGIPYVEGEYDKVSNRLNWPRFMNALRGGSKKSWEHEDKRMQDKGDAPLTQQEKTEIAERLIRGIFGAPNEQVRRIVFMHFVTLPKRLYKLVQGRGDQVSQQSHLLGEALSGMENVNTYQDLIDYFVKNHQLNIYFMMNDKYPEVYFAYLGFKGTPKNTPPIVITREGYFLEALEEPSSGKKRWKPNFKTKNKYTNHLIQNYKKKYSNNPRVD